MAADITHEPLFIGEIALRIHLIRGGRACRAGASVVTCPSASARLSAARSADPPPRRVSRPGRGKTKMRPLKEGVMVPVHESPVVRHTDGCT